MQTMRLVEGYNPPSRLRPGSLGLTLLTTGAFVSGLFFLNPHVAHEITTTLIATNVPLAPPPPPPPSQPQPKKVVEHQAQRIVVPPQPDFEIKPVEQPPITFTEQPPIDFAESGRGTGVVVPETAKPVVMIGANIDPRYASNFQPAYPSDEIRAGNAGRVTVRVLIGTDGRVKDIEKVSAASDSFWETTRRQALAKWRFKPATRDGVPYEAWKTMNVSFVLNQEQ